MDIIKKIMQHHPSCINHMCGKYQPMTPVDIAFKMCKPEIIQNIIEIVPLEILQSWTSESVKGAGFLIILETMGMSEAEVQADKDPQRQNIKNKFSKIYDHCQNSENPSKLFNDYCHKGRADRGSSL